MADGAIKYSDLIQDDGAIDKLLVSLTKVDSELKKLIDGSKDVAKYMQAALSRQDDKAVVIEITNRLNAAYKELVVSSTKVGKGIAVLRSEIIANNKASVDAFKAAQSAAGSYDQLRAKLNVLIDSYKKLSAAERGSDLGKQMGKDIQKLSGDIYALDKEMGRLIETTTSLTRAQGTLDYLRKEGQEAAIVKEQIRQLREEQEKRAKVQVGRDTQTDRNTLSQTERLKLEISELSLEYDELSAKEGYNAERANELTNAINRRIAAIKQLEAEQRQAQKTAMYENQLAETGIDLNTLSLEGIELKSLSYKQLEALYELLTQRANNFSAAELNNAETGGRIAESLRQVGIELDGLDNKLNRSSKKVRDLSGQWRQFSFSVSQIVRELPAAGISWNTFFLAISNNIPIFIDQLKEVYRVEKEVNGASVALGKTIKAIGRSLISWTTLITVILTIFSNEKFKESVFGFFESLFTNLDQYEKDLRAVGRRMKKDNDFGEQIANIKMLSQVWKQLNSDSERQAFLQDYREQLNKTGLAINNVNDAELALSQFTDRIVDSYKKRAAAAAAASLAEDEYKKAATNILKLDDEYEKLGGRGEVERLKAQRQQLLDIKKIAQEEIRSGVPVSERTVSVIPIDEIKELDELLHNIDLFESKLYDSEEKANHFIDIFTNKMKEANDIVHETGLEVDKLSEKIVSATTKADRYVLDSVKRYNQAYLGAMEDGHEKRMKAIQLEYEEQKQAVEDKIAEIQSFISENGYLLPPAQLEGLNSALALYQSMLGDNGLLGKTKKQKEDKENREELARQADFQRDRINLQLEAVKEGSSLEYSLKKQLIDKEQAAELAENATREAALQQSRLDIIAKYNKKREDLEHEHQLRLYEIRVETENLRLAGTQQGTESYYDVNAAKIRAERLKEIYANSLLAEEEKQDEALINAKYNKQIADNEQARYKMRVNNAINFMEDKKEIAKKDSREQLEISAQILAQQEEAEIEAAKIAELGEEAITAIQDKYAKRRKLLVGAYISEELAQQQELAQAIFDQVEHTEQQKTLFSLRLERERIMEEIALAEQGASDISDIQLQTLKETLKAINNQIERESSILGRIGEHGLFGLFDLTDEQYSALEESWDLIKDNIDQVIDKYVEMAEAAVSAAEEQVSAAQTVYEAELEARANGYANNVETAKKELELEKERLAEKQRLLDKAQRAQEVSDTMSQISSLITATANIWKSFSSLGVAGVALAIAATGTMFGSFAIAKSKAREAAQTYGEGGYEVLEGGSHASGHDIDLGVTNRRKRRMRAEGGEALAIINKRNTKKYSKELPSIINSLNKGTFEEQYLSTISGASVNLVSNQIDLSGIEANVSAIKKNSDTKTMSLPDGTLLVTQGNTKRIIKKL